MLDAHSIRDEYSTYLASPSPDIVRRTLDALAVDVSALLGVSRSDDALRTFREQLSGVEGMFNVDIIRRRKDCTASPSFMPTCRCVRRGGAALRSPCPLSSNPPSSVQVC